MLLRQRRWTAPGMRTPFQYAACARTAWRSVLRYWRSGYMQVDAGEFTDSEIIVMLGENGTGKTTFIRMLAGAPGMEPDDGADVDLPNFNISFKPQKISPKFTSTVRNLLHKRIRDAYIHPTFITDVMKPMQAMPLPTASSLSCAVSVKVCDACCCLDARGTSTAAFMLHGRGLRLSPTSETLPNIGMILRTVEEQRFSRAQENSEWVSSAQVDVLLDQEVQHLSGGELQRVAITMCLGTPADIYLIDEPSAYLDSEQRIVAAKVLLLTAL